MFNHITQCYEDFNCDYCQDTGQNSDRTLCECDGGIAKPYEKTKEDYKWDSVDERIKERLGE